MMVSPRRAGLDPRTTTRNIWCEGGRGRGGGGGGDEGFYGWENQQTLDGRSYFDAELSINRRAKLR